MNRKKYNLKTRFGRPVMCPICNSEKWEKGIEHHVGGGIYRGECWVCWCCNFVLEIPRKAEGMKAVPIIDPLKPDEEEKEDTSKYGFTVVSNEPGMNSVSYTATCSGSRSDCCTRVCSADANFAGSQEDWEKYLNVKGGQVQY